MKKNVILLFILFFTAAFAQNDNKQENYLAGANLISVTIGGKFLITGTFPASISERVNQFITRMYIPARDKYLLSAGVDPLILEKVKKDLNDFSFRNIILKRADGKEMNLDLEKFRLNGDFVNNPYLKNDDVIIFPQSDIERNYFLVSGAVNSPGRFHFVDGDKLKDALELAGGINKAYENVSNAEINRLSYDGRELNTISVDINSDFPLQRGDRVVVAANESMKKDFSVRILGEVNSPGIIPITKDKTTLYEVIKKAGGLTSSASLKRAKIFTGNSFYSLLEKQYGYKIKDYPTKADYDLTQDLLRMDELSMARMSGLVPEDTSYFNMENRLRILGEHSAVDFSQLNDPESEASKYKVKDNDLIIIPIKENNVYVFGQVLAQGHVPIVSGKDYRYYIEKAGGYGEYAEKGNVMIIKGVSRNWIEAEKNPVLEEGDYIYVPRNVARSFASYIWMVGGYLSIVASVATVILLLYQFKK